MKRFLVGASAIVLLVAIASYLAGVVRGYEKASGEIKSAAASISKDACKVMADGGTRRVLEILTWVDGQWGPDGLTKEERLRLALSHFQIRVEDMEAQ